MAAIAILNYENTNISGFDENISTNLRRIDVCITAIL